MALKLKRKTKWNEDLIWRAYELARDGAASHTQIAELLEMSPVTLKTLCIKHPALQRAIEQGQKVTGQLKDAEVDFHDLCLERLPPELRELWDRIVALDAEEPDNAEKLLEQLTADKGVREMQRLWVHALIASNFNKRDACRRTGVSQFKVNTWTRTDPGFAPILNLIKEARKDFAEAGLFRLIASNDSPAVIFANKTLNRDRGYDTKITVEHTGGVAHLHAAVDLQAVLDRLPLETKKQVLTAVRELQAPLALPAHQGENT